MTEQQPDLDAVARAILDANHYMTLGTADAAGHPWVSPVFFAADDYRDLYWISSPEATHSRNLAARPELSIVVFDSRAAVGAGDETAVYMAGTAFEVPPADLEHTLGAFPGFVGRGGREFRAADLRSPAPYRLYRAAVTAHFMLCPSAAGEPCERHGLRYDHRTQLHAL